jgi:dihydrofolate synthase/folylpolyglutamate synthase
MLESVYRTAGLRVGLFTSPHLVAFGERIQVNRQLISETEIVRLVVELQPLLKQFATGEHPTFFEVVTVMALRHFADQNCELVIWETGLGGRLDATNIVTPLASLITNIQYDHQQWLGETLGSIASEKAGIIKPGIPVLTATDEPEALKVIEQTAQRHHAPLTVLEPLEMLDQGPLANLELPLLGQHQRLNAALAIATVRVLASQIPVTEETIRAGLATLQWPGRLQLITRSSGQKILLDGAHNAAGAEIVAQAFRDYFPSLKPTLVLGVLQDKDWARICKILAPLASRILLAPVASERTCATRQLADGCRRANPAAEITEHLSLEAALSAALSDPFVLITGSLYLVGEAMELFQVTSRPTNERNLNEWGACAQSPARP